MSDYEVPHRHVGVHEKQLAPGMVDRVFFRAGGGDQHTPGWGNTIKQVEVMSDGVADIYLTMGEQPLPEIRGTQSWRVPAFGGSSVLPVPKTAFTATGDLQINLISEGSPTYSVSRT